ncbi:hypothetical protein [Geobacter sp. FeAm09]|uniref:hypothetical protein n=1 Tax=Geobacter sp. FeAm09 TaxID=2597769 RepID=UPI00197AE4FF|nr:hypothetical protein [Geobacter sp. FeAm09]
MHQPKQAQVAQLLRQRLPMLAEPVPQFGRFTTDKLVVEAVLYGLGKANHPHAAVLVANVFHHGFQQLIKVCRKVFVWLVQELLKHLIQLPDNISITAVIGRSASVMRNGIIAHNLELMVKLPVIPIIHTTCHVLYPYYRVNEL